jgi:O-antigen/teichoic acid export membrane protein
MTDNSSNPETQALRTNASRKVWNVASNWGGFVLSGLVNFALAPFVVRHLGNADYGIMVLLLSVTGYLGLLDVGVRGATTRYVARFHSKTDHDSSSRFVSSSLALFSVLGCLTILIFLGLAIFVGSLPIAKSDLGWARILLVLVGPNVAISLISGVFSGIPMALQRFSPVNIVGVSSNALRAVAMVLALMAGGGLIAIALIQLGTTIVATLAIAWVAFRIYPDLKVKWNLFDREHLGLVLSFSVFSFTLLIFDTVVIYLNSVIVGIFLSASMVTFFAISSNLVNYCRSIVSGISKTATPQASALEARSDARGLQHTLLDGAGFATVVTLPIAATFLIRGKAFIGLWMGSEYAGLSGNVLWILTIGLVFSAGNQVALATMLGVSKHKALVPFFLAQALCNVVLSTILIRTLGLTGVAWATTVPYLLMSLFFWPWYVRRHLGISFEAYARKVWVRALLAIAPFAGATWIVEKLWPAPNLFIFFLETAIIIPVALICFWFFYLSTDQRHALSPVFVDPATRFLLMRTKRSARSLP